MSDVLAIPGIRTCIFLLLLLLLVPRTMHGQQAGAAATVTGRILDEVGNGVSWVEIHAVRDGRRIGRTASDSDGRYALDVPPGPVRIRVDGGMGWTSTESEDLVAPAGGHLVVDLAVERQIYDTEAVVVTVDGPGGRSSVTRALGWVDLVREAEIQRSVTVNPVDPIRDRPGVDLVDTGLGSRVVTFRGFNNIFSGSVRYLVDYRKASLPSLRANFTHFVPTTTFDMERMELVLGPSSALYGPNSANGVMNVLTRSSLDLPETRVALSGGSQSVFQADVRTSRRLTERMGLKISTRWFQGREYDYEDPTEVSVRALVETDPEAFRDQLRDLGVPEGDIATREARVGIRDNDIERWSVDGRFDWAPSDGDTVVVQAGRMSTTGIEVTPFGGAQAGDWQNDYVQARFHSGSLFAQAYLNASDAGDSYLLRDGAALFDRSRVVGLQARHAVEVADGRAELTWGGDWTRTTPKTGGTIHGQFEDEDEITEYGGYVQVDTRLTDRVQLIANLRADESNVIDRAVLSPRVGLVFEPREGQTFSASWSRGFSTPTPTNYFLDLPAGAASGPLGALGYRLRARGTGRDGIRFTDGEGGFQGMRSPCTPAELGGPSQLVPVDASLLWQCGVGILLANEEIDPQTARFLATLDPSGTVTVNAFDPVAESLEPLAPGVVRDVEPLEETTTSTFEVGYRGLVGERVFVQTALWRTEKRNFTSPPLLRTPLLTLDGSELAAFLVSSGLPVEQAQTLAAGMAPIPLAVLSSSDMNGSGAELIATYENHGSITYWGIDLGARASLSRSLTLSAAGSWVSDDHFDVDGELVTLNAPEFKGSVALGVDNLSLPLSGEARVRYHSEFPVASGDYIGTGCIDGRDGALVQGCVDATTLVDLTAGYEGLFGSDVALRLSVSNLFDTAYRPFVAVPTQGRRFLARLEYRIR